MAELDPVSLDEVLGPDFAWPEPVKAEVVRVPPPANGPILMIVTGLLVLVAAAGDLGPIGVPLGLVTIAVAVGWWIWKKPTYQLRLSTPTGESVPLESRSQEEVERVATAIRAEAADRSPGDPVHEDASP